jgi:hypothetical protein
MENLSGLPSAKVAAIRARKRPDTIVTASFFTLSPLS